MVEYFLLILCISLRAKNFIRLRMPHLWNPAFFWLRCSNTLPQFLPPPSLDKEKWKYDEIKRQVTYVTSLDFTNITNTSVHNTDGYQASRSRSKFCHVWYIYYRRRKRGLHFPFDNRLVSLRPPINLVRGSLFKRLREAEKRDPGNEVGHQGR